MQIFIYIEGSISFSKIYINMYYESIKENVILPYLGKLLVTLQETYNMQNNHKKNFLDYVYIYFLNFLYTLFLPRKLSKYFYEYILKCVLPFLDYHFYQCSQDAISLNLLSLQCSFSKKDKKISLWCNRCCSFFLTFFCIYRTAYLLSDDTTADISFSLLFTA